MKTKTGLQKPISSIFNGMGQTDFVKNNGGIVRLTLGSLPPGEYQATSYHVDPDFTQSGEIHVDIQVSTGGTFVDTGAVGNSNFTNGGNAQYEHALYT